MRIAEVQDVGDVAAVGDEADRPAPRRHRGDQHVLGAGGDLLGLVGNALRRHHDVVDRMPGEEIVHAAERAGKIRDRPGGSGARTGGRPHSSVALGPVAQPARATQASAAATIPARRPLATPDALHGLVIELAAVDWLALLAHGDLLEGEGVAGEGQPPTHVHVLEHLGKVAVDAGAVARDSYQSSCRRMEV